MSIKSVCGPCMQAYARLRQDTPELLDLVAQFAGQDLTDEPMSINGASAAPVSDKGKLRREHSLLCGSKRFETTECTEPMSVCR